MLCVHFQTSVRQYNSWQKLQTFFLQNTLKRTLCHCNFENCSCLMFFYLWRRQLIIIQDCKITCLIKFTLLPEQLWLIRPEHRTPGVALRCPPPWQQIFGSCEFWAGSSTSLKCSYRLGTRKFQGLLNHWGTRLSLSGLSMKVSVKKVKEDTALTVAPTYLLKRDKDQSL